MPRKRGFFDERDALDILREAFGGKPKRTRKPRVQLASFFGFSTSNLITPEVGTPIPDANNQGASTATPSAQSDIVLIAKSNEARLAELQILIKERTLTGAEEQELHARTAARVSQYDISEVEKVLETSRQIGTEIPQGYNNAAAIIKLEITKLKSGSASALPSPAGASDDLSGANTIPPSNVSVGTKPTIESPVLPTSPPSTPPMPIKLPSPLPTPAQPKQSGNVPHAPLTTISETEAPMLEVITERIEATAELPSIDALEEQMKSAVMHANKAPLPPAPPTLPTPPKDSNTSTGKSAPRKPIPAPIPQPELVAPKIEGADIHAENQKIAIPPKPATTPKPLPISKIKPLDTLEPTPLTPEETDDLLSGQYPEAIVSPEDLALVLEKKKIPAASKKPSLPKKSRNFLVTAKKGDALWNLIEDRLGSSDAMGKDFANKFNALPSSKRIHIIDAVETFIRKSADLFHIADPNNIRPGDTFNLGPILDDEKSMLELVVNAQDKEKALDAVIVEMDNVIVDRSRANGDKTPIEHEIDKAIFGPILPVEEVISTEDDPQYTPRPISEGLPGTEKNKIEIKLYPEENHWRKFLGFTAEHYNSIRNIKVKQILDLVPSREKAETSWNSAVRQELLDVPRRNFESLVRLSEFIRGYSSGNGKGIREMTIRQFFGGICRNKKN